MGPEARPPNSNRGSHEGSQEAHKELQNLKRDPKMDPKIIDFWTNFERSKIGPKLVPLLALFLFGFSDFENPGGRPAEYEEVTRAPGPRAH